MATSRRDPDGNRYAWDTHKDLLRRLWLQDGSDLESVMKYMSEVHGFRAEKWRYEAKFREWRFRKNIKKPEWRIISKEISARAEDGKQSGVFHHGIQVPPEQVRRATSRYKDVASEPSDERLSPDIEIRTPKLCASHVISAPQFTTTAVEEVATRSKRTWTTAMLNVRGSTSPIDVAFKKPRGSTESPVPGVLEDFRLDDASPVPFELIQTTDALANAQAMVHVPTTSGFDTSAILGAPGLASQKVNKYCGRRLDSWERYGESSRQSGPEFLLYSEAAPAVLQDLSFEGLNMGASWLTNEPSLPGGPAVLQDLALEVSDLSTSWLTNESSLAGGVFLQRSWSPSPLPINVPDRLITRSLFAVYCIGSPWSHFQSAVLVPPLSTHVDTSMSLPRVPPELQSSLSDLVYSMLSHSNGSITLRNPNPVLEQMFSTYFPVDEIQDFQLLQAVSGISFIDQLVAMMFGLISNGIFTEEELAQFLDMIMCSAPKALLRRLLNSETSTARAASERLLKNVVTRGNEDALSFLLDIGMRKERLSGTGGGVLLECALDNDETEIAKRIALAGATPNSGKPLLWAVDVEDLEFVEILLKAGADVDCSDENDLDTPLSRAVHLNFVPCVSMLLESGAIVDTTTVSDYQGWTGLYFECFRLPVLDYASLMGYTTTYRLLLERSLTAKSCLTISGIVRAARAGPNQLEVYLKQHASENGKERTTFLENALLSAIRHDTEDTAIDVLLDFNVHPDAPTLEAVDELPLCHAIPNVDLVGRLIYAGADLERPEIILSAATNEGNFDCLNYLITSGLNLQAMGSFGLGQAIRNGNMDIMKLLLDNGAPATGYCHDGSCLAAIAVEMRNRGALQLLLQHGADVNDVNGNGSRPIHSAAATANLEMVKFLVEKGALLDHSGLRGNGYGTVLEEWAIHKKYLPISDLFTYLLENGAPVNAPEVIRGALRRNSLLTMLILQSAEDDLVHQVLERGARVNETRLPHIQGARTPVQAAAEMGKLDLVRELYEKGADINAAPGFKLGRTALQAACNAKRTNMELVVYLLDNGADINAKASCDGGLTAIQGAAIQGNIKLVALLMDRGADLHADPAIKNGRTALEGAAEHGRLDMVHLLLSAGAGCTRQGTSGYDSAIELAKAEGHWEVANILARAGGVDR